MLCADLGSNCLADTWFSSFYFVSFWSTNPQEKTGKDTGSIVSSQPTLYLLGEGIKKRYHPWIQHELALSQNHTEKTKPRPRVADSWRVGGILGGSSLLKGRGFPQGTWNCFCVAASSLSAALAGKSFSFKALPSHRLSVVAECRLTRVLTHTPRAL